MAIAFTSLLEDRFASIEGHQLAILGIAGSRRDGSSGRFAPIGQRHGTGRYSDAQGREEEQFLDIMRNSPEIMQGIIRLLLARLREADEKLSKD